MQNVTKVSAEELKSRLSAGVVRFFFQKKDGSLREALGTSNLSSIPQGHHPSGVRQAPSSVVPFFDIEKQQWRSAKVDAELWA